MEGVGSLKMDSFYRGKRVLVTGHTGFKGSWLCQLLLLLGAQVYGYAFQAETESLFEQARLKDRVESCLGDVRDRRHLTEYLLRVQPEIVFHLAAQPIVRKAYQNPAETFETNIMGTVNVLEAARAADSVRSLINITTDKVYDNREWVWGYRETDRLGGSDPYSCSKACSELVTRSYTDAFFSGKDICISTARAGNVIGGGDFAADRIVPDCVRAVLRGAPIKVRNPNSIRPYQYVLEALYAYLLLAQCQWEQPDLAGSYNVGPDQADCVTTGRLAGTFCRLWGQGARWETEKPGHAPKESLYLRLDSAKIKWSHGWRPVMGFEEAMEWTVAWYHMFGQGKDMAAYSEREAGRYLERREQDVEPGRGPAEDFGDGAWLLGAIS